MKGADTVAYMSAEERRKVILDAAVEVIAEKGFAGATTRLIAERADSPLGALHYCFRGKDELLSLVLGRGAASMRAAFESVDPQQGFAATVDDCAQTYWTWIRTNLGLHMALMELLLWSIRGQPVGKDFYSTATDPFGGELLRAKLTEAARVDGTRPAVAIDELIRFMIHRFDGLTLEFAASRDTAGCDRQVELLTRALLALAVPDTSPDTA